MTRLLLGGDLLAGLGQVAVAVAIGVQRVAVEDEPDAVLGFGTEGEQPVLRGRRLVSGFFSERAVDLRRIGTGGQSGYYEAGDRRDQEAGHASPPGSS